MLVAAFFLFTDLQLLAVRVGHTHRLADLIQVVASRRGRAAADRLISSRLGVLPAGIDIAARERRIGTRVGLEAIGELLAAGRDVKDWREAAVQLWTAIHDRLRTRYAMRQLMPTTRDGAVVLLVQPCDDGLRTYAEYLCEYGLAVIAVSDAWDALIAAPKADVIVTGILLAGSMDGVELISRLRRDERADRRPIIVLTACAWDAERERATRAGCDLFLAKPCVPGEVLRHVRASLADVALQRVRGKAAKADLLSAPRVALGVAADSTQRSTTQLGTVLCRR